MFARNLVLPAIFNPKAGLIAAAPIMGLAALAIVRLLHL